MRAQFKSWNGNREDVGKDLGSSGIPWSGVCDLD